MLSNALLLNTSEARRGVRLGRPQYLAADQLQVRHEAVHSPLFVQTDLLSYMAFVP